VLAELPGHAALAAGELVTTGTLTAALPAVAGQTWTTRVSGLAAAPLGLQLM
jgi:2-oxo-3-hexenedioate decarboxylase